MNKNAFKKIRWLSTWVLILIFLASSIIPVSALTPDPFSDVPSTHWAYTAVMNMVRIGIISGYPDGTFKPDQFVSREEYAKILCGATSIPLASPNTNTFADITADHWAFRYVETVKDYLTGYPSDNGSKPLFKGKFDATREDVAVALVKIKGFDKTVMPNPNILSDMFKDTSSISSSLKNLMAIAVEKKLIEGYPDQTIRGSQTLTRAEAAVLIDRANRIAGDVKNVSYFNSAKLISLTIDCTETTGIKGENILAKANGVYSNGQTRDITNEVKWTSSDISVLSVAIDGKILLLKEGTASILAVLDEKSDEQEIAVTSDSSNSEIIKFIKLSPETKEIKVNDTINMKAEAVYENGNVVNITDQALWDSTNSNIAIVSSHGKVLGIKEGTVLVKAGYKNLTGYAGISVAESVYSHPSTASSSVILSSITISHSYKEMKKGSKLNLKVIGSYNDFSKKDITGLVTWSVDNNSIITINQNGEVTAISEGVAKITAVYEGKSFTAYIAVKKR